MNIRSLKGRLRRVEQRIKTTHLAAFEKSLRPEQREALYQAGIQSIIAEDGEDREAIAIEILMDDLGLDEGDAVDLWQRYEAAQASEPIDPEFERLTDAELLEYLERTREEIRALVAVDEAA